MPIGTWGKDDTPLLSGLFGAFQAASRVGASTAELWQSLRVNAGVWVFQNSGGGDLPPIAELEATGKDLLHEQGVGIQQVNTYRSIAGEWKSAKEALQRSDGDQQITGQMIFQPPWAQTTTDAVPSRYRMRVEWTVDPGDGDEFHTWGTYEMSDPLTTVNDALDQAQTMVGKKPTSDIPLGAVVTGVNDYEMEQI